MMDNITQRLAVYRGDMSREFGLRLSDVDQRLKIFENRGVAFSTRRSRLAAADLLDRPRLEAQFREQVISDIDLRPSRTAWGDPRGGWSRATGRGGQQVMERIRRRKRCADQLLSGRDPQRGSPNRKELIESVGLAAQEALQTYDQEGEAYRIALSLEVGGQCRAGGGRGRGSGDADRRNRLEYGTQGHRQA